MSDPKPQLAKEVSAKEGQRKIAHVNADEPAAKKAKKGAKSNVKRATTIDKTVQEAKLVLGGTDLADTSAGRKTRSASRGETKTPLKKAGTMVTTAKEGKAFLKRGKKATGKKAKDTKKDKEEKVEEAEEEEKTEEENEEKSE